jgi:hypothetical protein
MRSFIVTLFLIGSTLGNIYAQGKITGVVTDEQNVPVIAAHITLSDVTNSKVIESTITNDNGEYEIPLENVGIYKISISCLGYLSQDKEISITKELNSQIHSFILKENIISLNEIMVTGRQTGISYRGDTIKYNPNVFKDGSERVLGDLLNKLPGIEVDATGNVKSQGKTVDKVLFNGQDYFNGNSQVAIQNLSANIADKVEVINNYSEYSLLDGLQTHEGTALNVGVNESFLGKLNGELSVGYGIEDKYNLRSNIMKMGNKSMLAFIGSYNNTGSEVFTIDDYIQLQGGAKSIVNSKSTNFIALSEEEKQLLSPQNNVNSRRNGLGSLNFASQLSSKLRFNGYLLYNSKKEKSYEENKNTYIIPDQENLLFFNETFNKQRTNFIGSNLNLKYDASESLKIDYKAVITGSGLFSDSEIRDNRNNTNILTFDKKNTKSFNMNHTLSFIKKTTDGLINGDINGQFHRADTHYPLMTDSLLFPVFIDEGIDFVKGEQEQDREDYMFSINLAYTHKFDKLLLKGGISSSFKNNSWDNIFIVLDSENQSYQDENKKDDIQSKLWDNSLHLSLSKKTGFFRFNVGGYIHLYNLSMHSFKVGEKTTIKFTPDVNLTLYFNSKNIIKAYYNTEYDILSPEFFTSRQYVINYRTIFKGNKFKTVWSKQYNLGLSYQFYDLFSNTMFFLTGGYRENKNGVTYNYHSNGILSERVALNSPETYTAFGNMYLEKGLSIPLKFNFTVTYNFTGLTNYIDDVKNQIKINNVTGRVSLLSKFDCFINVGMFADISDIDNHSSIYKNSNNQLTQYYGGELKLNFSNKLVADIQGGYMTTKIGSFTKETVLLNGTLRYAFNKNIELSLTWQNMLNLKNMSWNTVIFDGYQEKEQLFFQIPGNILLHLSYKF